MKVVMNIEMPVEPFNSMVRSGTAAQTLGGIVEELNPESAYFYAPHGCRGGTLVVDVNDPAEIPSLAEPFFLKFGARCEFNIAMTPEDLARGGLDELGRKWA